MTEKPGIYAIRQRQSGKCYVGRAGNISKRWHIHRKNLNSAQHKNLHLQAAWVKYGADSFDWIILELTTNLTEREQFWMDTCNCYQNGFNVCPIARRSRGRILSAAERQMRRTCLQMARCHNQAPEARARRVATRRQEKTLGHKGGLAAGV